MAFFIAESTNMLQKVAMRKLDLEKYKEKRGAFFTAEPTKPQSLKRVVVFKVDLQDDKEKKRALKTVMGISGVNSISWDWKTRMLTVIGEVDPVKIVSKLRKNRWVVKIVSVAPPFLQWCPPDLVQLRVQRRKRSCLMEESRRRKMIHVTDDEHHTWSSEAKKFKTYQYNSLMDTTRAQYMIVKNPSFRICSYYFVALFFPYCNLNHLWNGGDQLLVNLKSIDLSHSCNLLRIPDLSMAQKLESLSLEGCESLVGVSSIQYLTSLQHLNLKRCQSLERLPSLIRLKLLKTLDLSHCSNLTRLPPSLGCLSNLCELNLRNCVKLDHLPASVIRLITCVETLNISGCSSLLKSIAATGEIACPQDLKHVDIDADGYLLVLPPQDLDEESFMATPLIDFLPTELRSRLFPSDDNMLAELEHSVPETVMMLKLKEMDAKLTAGGLELSYLDSELSRILDEEEEIEAELQRLMGIKSDTFISSSKTKEP